MSASKLSKIETGKLAPSVVDAEGILTAIGVSNEVKAEYLEAARAAATEATAWRLVRRIGVHKAQQQTRALEAQMRSLRLFQPALVPGLLQTPEYIRAILSRHDLGEDVLTRTISARIERQQALYDSTKELCFVITESVLRWRIVSATRMAEQIDRLASLSRLPNIDIRVVPLAAQQQDIANHAFVIRDDRTVTVETIHAEIVVTDPQDVSLYVRKFERFAATALAGEDMRATLASIRDGFLREQETG
ncbi:regulator [Streptomyces agglomeratus]|uniref:Regulator n=2 Tax=Streptomyces agglomeratus TaxID=285458 RepID=A0A1E5P741_9ACTN|nr:regulator [Streptomyces agglomeratus]OEJ40597.1 regulator [Streptomyces agglomeratus]OEJ45022.1 regulator [Streptomyces agglomeratus]OEJ53146.1 regulator [Streptomyces agglomeratus]OEJ60482.1 regulator [Streptomyces agglomeratus]